MTKKKLGRPPKTFTAAQKKKIATLAFAGMKNNCIATFMDIDQATFETHFKKLCTKKRSERKLWLLELQNKKAKTKDTTMLIWLGKNVLDQTDKQETTHGLTSDVTDLLSQLNGKTRGLPND